LVFFLWYPLDIMGFFLTNFNHEFCMPCNTLIHKDCPNQAHLTWALISVMPMAQGITRHIKKLWNTSSVYEGHLNLV
jgi:hypothetical protein